MSGLSSSNRVNSVSLSAMKWGRGLGRARGQDMGYTMRPRHRLHFYFFAPTFVEVKRGAKTACIVSTQLAQKHFDQVDFVSSKPLGLQAHLHSDKGLADKTQTTLPTYLPVAPDTAHSPTGRIRCPFQKPAIRWPARPIAFSWGSLPQRFVRAFPVINLNPPIGSASLSKGMARWRSGQIRFKLPMHLFVRTVLFGVPRRNELNFDSQGSPPGTQTRKTRRALG